MYVILKKKRNKNFENGIKDVKMPAVEKWITFLNEVMTQIEFVRYSPKLMKTSIRYV